MRVYQIPNIKYLHLLIKHILYIILLLKPLYKPENKNLNSFMTFKLLKLLGFKGERKSHFKAVIIRVWTDTEIYRKKSL